MNAEVTENHDKIIMERKSESPASIFKIRSDPEVSG